jgi:hypothetical protein
MHNSDPHALCHRHGFDLVEVLPGRIGGSVAVLHVRDRAGKHFILKQTDALHTAAEIAALRAASGSGVTPRFEGELEPGVYVAEWLAGRSLADVPLSEPVDATTIGRALRRLHGIPPPGGLHETSDWLRPGQAAQWQHLPAELRALGERLAAGLHAYHPPKLVLLHGDLVPVNVLLTAAGPRFIDPAGFVGLPAWDLAQLAISAEGRGRRGMLPGLIDGYGAEVPQIAEMAGWMVLYYLDKNLAVADSPFTQHLQPLAELLAAAPDTTAFLNTCLSRGGA